jgi:hypothetical protein
MDNPRGYGRGQIFTLPDSNLARCHPYLGPTLHSHCATTLHCRVDHILHGEVGHRYVVAPLHVLAFCWLAFWVYASMDDIILVAGNLLFLLDIRIDLFEHKNLLTMIAIVHAIISAGFSGFHYHYVGER